MTFARLALGLVVVAALTGCSSPDEQAHEFGVWASSLEHVASVDAAPGSGESGMTAHLVVDAAIDATDLTTLARSLTDRALDKGISSPDINLIVGNAWGFSVDNDGVNVATINSLREEKLLVGATVWYQPLDPTADYAGGIRGVVGSQAGLRDAPASLIAAYGDSGGSIEGVPVTAVTANGAFGIAGVGDSQPKNAIALWQAISGRVMLTGAHASVAAEGPERLDVTVVSAEDQAVAESIASQTSDVTLTVTTG